MDQKRNDKRGYHRSFYLNKDLALIFERILQHEKKNGNQLMKMLVINYYSTIKNLITEEYKNHEA